MEPSEVFRELDLKIMMDKCVFDMKANAPVLTGCFKPGMRRGMYRCDGCAFSAGIGWCFAVNIREQNKENVYYVFNKLG